jgi:hypothetical protein
MGLALIMGTPSFFPKGADRKFAYKLMFKQFMIAFTDHITVFRKRSFLIILILVYFALLSIVAPSP